VFPDHVPVYLPEKELPDGTKIKDVLSLSAGDVAAALHHEAILALMDQIDALESEVKALKGV
jgi:hypothetical protein